MKKVLLFVLLLVTVLIVCSNASADSKVITTWAFSGLHDEDQASLDQMVLEVEVGRAFLQGYGIVSLSPAVPSGTAIVSGAGYITDNGAIVFSLQLSQHLLIIAAEIVTTGTGVTWFGDAFLYSPSGTLISQGTVLLLGFD